MTTVDGLLTAYRRQVGIDWEPHLAGPQRVWFLVHDPALERQVRFALERFRQATTEAGHGWVPIELGGRFGEWLATQRYRDRYFADPAALTDRLGAFNTWLGERIAPEIAAAPEDAVVVLVGAAALFGLTSLSALEEAVAPAIRGRLLVPFPGDRIDASYRFMGAGDGWNYLAIPITGDSTP